MYQHTANLVRLYLPLLISSHVEIRQQACIVLLSTYGQHAYAYLQDLLDDPDPQTQEHAVLALQNLSALADVAITLRVPTRIYIECLGGLRVYVDGRIIQPHDRYP